MWEDSYGNVLTYFAPFFYHPNSHVPSSTLNYQYMALKKKGEDLLFYVAPNKDSVYDVKVNVYCQLPLDPPTPPVYEPPTPVEGKTKH